jgi:hypothetical protein
MSQSMSIAANPASSSALPSRSPEADTPSLAIQSYMLAASISSVTILKLCGVSTTKPPRPCPLLRNGDCAASSPGYCWGAREYGVKLSGFLVREVQILTHEIRCQQVQSTRPDWMIDAWQKQLIADVSEMCRQFREASEAGWDDSPHPFSQAFDNACHDFNHPCAFVDLCSSEHPDRWLDNFAVRRWDPLTRTED